MTILANEPTAFNRLRFDDRDKVTINGTPHRPVAVNEKGACFVRTEGPELATELSHREVLDLFTDGALVINNEGLEVREPFDLPLEARIRALGPRALKRFENNRAYVHAFLALERDGQDVSRTLAGAARAIDIIRPTLPTVVVDDEPECRDPRSRRRKAPHRKSPKKRTRNLEPRSGRERLVRDAPSPKSLLNLLAKHRKAGGDDRALIPNYKPGKGKSRLPAEIEVIIQAAIDDVDHTMQAPPLQTTYDEVRDRIDEENGGRDDKDRLDYPRDSSIRQRIYERDQFRRTVAREGLPMALRKFAPDGDFHGTDVPNAEWQVDEWETDVQTLLTLVGVWRLLNREERRAVKRVRCWLTAARDVATRCVTGIHVSIGSPHVGTSLATLRMGIADKSALASALDLAGDWPMCGPPDKIVYDRGSAALNNVFWTRAAEAGIGVYHPPARVPRLRGIIERLFRTLSTRVMPVLPGRTFGSPSGRGDYPSGTLAGLTPAELTHLLTIGIVDGIHNAPSADLCGLTPALAWKRAVHTYGIRPPLEQSVMRMAFGVEVVRNLDRHGIDACALRYGGSQIADLHKRLGDCEVTIRIDPADVSAISVWDGEGWRTARAMHDWVEPGTSLPVWERFLADLRAENADACRLSERVARQAFARVRAMALEITQERGMPLPVYRPEDLDNAEREFFRAVSFAFPDDLPAVDGPTPLEEALNAVPALSAPDRVTDLADDEDDLNADPNAYVLHFHGDDQ